MAGKKSRGRPRRQWKYYIVEWSRVDNSMEAGRPAVKQSDLQARDGVWADTATSQGSSFSKAMECNVNKMIMMMVLMKPLSPPCWLRGN